MYQNTTISTVMMTRDNQVLLIQGMVHVGPPDFYQQLQKELDAAHACGFRIFFESVDRLPKRKPLTSNEKDISKFLKFIMGTYSPIANQWGYATQNRAIKYPSDAVNADVSFSELTRSLDQNGFKPYIWTYYIRHLPKKERKRSKLKAFLTEQGSGNSSLVKLFARFAFWFLMRKAKYSMLDFRNETCVEKIRGESRDINMFVHYGEAHVKGLVELLVKDGWSVAEWSERRVLDFVVVEE